jgi:hypothetical protein
MDLDEFLRKLNGDDLIKKEIRVERLKVERYPGQLAKVTISAQRMDETGTNETLSYVENSVLSCGHVAKLAGVCQCGSSFSFCQACTSSPDNRCIVCSELMCPLCRAKSFLHNKAICHKKCRWKLILINLFGR